MKKLLLLCFVIILSVNLQAQETAAEKKAAKAKTEKLALAKKEKAEAAREKATLAKEKAVTTKKTAKKKAETAKDKASIAKEKAERKIIVKTTCCLIRVDFVIIVCSLKQI